jgi:hypothetical protein
MVNVINTTATTCSGSSTGALTFNATGGTTPYDYAWDGPTTNDGTATNQGSPYVVNNLPAGSYAVAVTDGKGCTYTETVTITDGTTLAVNSIDDFSLCIGASAAELLLSSVPANAAIQYAWSGGATAGLANGSSTGLNPAIPGFTAGSAANSYTVTVTATLGACTDTEEFIITVESPAPTITCASLVPVTRVNTPDQCGYIVQGTEFDPATVVVNCGNAVLTNDYNGMNSLGGVLLPVSGSAYLVTWKVTDDGGNTATCEISITVEDNQDPVFITCPPSDVTLSLAPGGCTTVLTWPIPVAEDNCGI